MVSRRKGFIFILLVIPVISVLGQDTFRGTEAYHYIETLCRSEFEGRKTGLPGARKAAEWIAGKFQEWGLEPGGDNGTYIQTYPMPVTHQKKKSKLYLKNGVFGSNRYQQGNDYTVYFNSGSGKVTSEVIFAGFGISEPEKGWDDYANLDVRGKIVMIYRGLPKDGKDWSAQNERDYKMKTATEKGVAALIVFEGRDWAVRGGTIHEEGYNPDLPAVAVSKKVARDIFQGTYLNMDHVLRDLAKKPQSFSTGKIVTLDLKLTRVEPGEGENVIGILRGSDPVLRNEFIVVGGHMDHNGVSPTGLLYAGADDNASGTAVIMELARILSGSPQKSKRTIVFVGFGAEEQGLRGSTYLADHPTVPADKICLMFNFDMEGCGDGGGGFGGRNYFPQIVDQWKSSLSDSVRKKLSIGRGWGYGGSDHAPFIAHGIPAFGLHSSGDHPFWHRVEDRPRTINVQSLQFVGDRATELLTEFGNYSQSLLYNRNHQGRCFLLFGNQVVFQGPPFVRFQKKLTDSLITRVSQKGINGIVLAMTRGELWETDANDFYKAIDNYHLWIKEHRDLLVPLKSGGSLYQSSGSGKLAVALALNEADLDVDDLGEFRNLARLGVRFLRITDPSAPLFNQDGWSDFGKEILTICHEEKVIIDWTIDDALFTRYRLPEIKGNAMFRWSAEDLLHTPMGFEEILKDKNRLICIEGHPKTTAQDLLRLIERFGMENSYFSMTHRSSSKDSEACQCQTMAPWAFPLLQKLYNTMIKNEDTITVYRFMEKILGGNLRAFLDAS